VTCPNCGFDAALQQPTLPEPVIIDGRDILRRAFDMRVVDRLERKPDVPPEDGPSLAQGVMYGVSAVLEVLKDQDVPITIEGVDLTQVAREIARTEP
jgi:hypothetical protein